MSDKNNQPIHPGKILLEEFLKPMGISQNKLSRELDVPLNRINEIIHGKRAITADTALRFSRFFGTTPEYWMHLQTDYDLTLAKLKNGEYIKKRVSTDFSRIDLYQTSDLFLDYTISEP